MEDLPEELMSVLDVRPTKDLLSHEQTIPKNLKRLKEGMLNMGHLVDPLIVDKESNVVLDGNHRLKVLEIIECPNSACQMVDYKDPKITVGSWLPVVKMEPEEMIRMGKIKAEKADRPVAMEAIAATRAPFAALSRKSKAAFLLNPGKYKLRDMVEEQVLLLSMFNDAEVKYINDDELDQWLDMGYTALYRRPYTKEEIVKSARDHAPFPPKSTRHLIPGRIIRLNMKLGWLHLDREAAKKEMIETLKRRAYSGNVRKYYEPVVVIY